MPLIGRTGMCRSFFFVPSEGRMECFLSMQHINILYCVAWNNRGFGYDLLLMGSSSDLFFGP